MLRAVDAGQHQLAFHTDVRSPKVDALARASDLCWLFYDPQAKLQLRIAAQARVLTQGPYFEQRWAASRPSSRACYVHRVAPGTPLGHPLEYGPVNESGAALEAVTARGRDNFAVVLTTVRRIDWLSLSHRGHRRLRFNVTPLGFDSLWIAP